MSRTLPPAVTLSVFKNPPVVADNGHVITVHADYGVFDENTQLPISSDKTSRK